MKICSKTYLGQNEWVPQKFFIPNAKLLIGIIFYYSSCSRIIFRRQLRSGSITHVDTHAYYTICTVVGILGAVSHFFHLRNQHSTPMRVLYHSVNRCRIPLSCSATVVDHFCISRRYTTGLASIEFHVTGFECSECKILRREARQAQYPSRLGNRLARSTRSSKLHCWMLESSRWSFVGVLLFCPPFVRCTKPHCLMDLASRIY
jgi:hypothetical protein